MWKRFLSILPGFLLPNLLAPIAVWCTSALVRREPDSAAILIFSQFLLIPLMMGFLSAFCWRHLETTVGQYVGWSAINTFLGIATSYFTMREGVICLLIVSPLLFCFGLAGTLIGRNAFMRSSRLSICFVPLLLVILVIDARTPHRHETSVTDTLLVQAPPKKVWKHVVEVSEVPPSQFWLFQLGMPRPVRTVAPQARVGSQRLCVFERNMVLEERIVALEPERELTFDIVKQPDHPELLGHVTLTRGQIKLQDNGDGTTTLIGTSWYRLHVFPAWYYQLWCDHLCREIHWSVMGQMKTLAERRT